MAERLTMQEVIEHCDETTELMERVFTCIHDGGEFGHIESKRYLEHKQTAEWLRQLQKYKDLEEQGRLITLPCKIGDTVYEVQETRKRIQEYTVISVHHSHCSTLFGWTLKDGKGVYSNLNGFEEHAIGKTVFLTKEEAEAALKEVDE